MLSEALIGMLLGLAVQFVFEAAQLAGQVMGMQVGYGLVNILDPNTQVDTPVLSVFSQTMAMLIFLQLGVHRWLVRALAASFTYLPAGTALATGEHDPATAARRRRHLAGGSADRRAGAAGDAAWSTWCWAFWARLRRSCRCCFWDFR